MTVYPTPSSPYGFSMDASTGSANQIITTYPDMTMIGQYNIPGVWYRYFLHWTFMQPTSTSSIDWTIPDEAVQYCNAHNINYIWPLCGVPTWAQVSNSYVTVPCPDPTKTATFLAAVASRYNGGSNGTIAAFEVCNEEYINASDLLHWYQIGQEAATLHKALYSAIKGVSSNFIVGGPVLVSGSKSWQQSWMNGWYSQTPVADYLQMHTYGDAYTTPPNCVNTQGYIPSDALSVMGCINWQDQVMTANFDNTPIWVTEWGWPTQLSAGVPSYINDVQCSEYVVEMLNFFQTQKRVHHVCMYSLSDWLNNYDVTKEQLPHFTFKAYSQKYPTWPNRSF